MSHTSSSNAGNSETNIKAGCRLALNEAKPASPVSESMFDLLVRLTTTRASNLDNLDKAITALETAIRGTDNDDLKTLSDQIDTKKLRLQKFTASGTWTKPTNVDVVFVICVGGGGGGASSGSSSYYGGGGGGGQVKSGYVSVSGDVSVTIGAGGAGGASGENAGNDGGDTSFGTDIIAEGGKGGNPGTSSEHGTGGKGGGCNEVMNSIGGGFNFSGAGGNTTANGKDSPRGMVAVVVQAGRMELMVDLMLLLILVVVVVVICLVVLAMTAAPVFVS